MTDIVECDFCETRMPLKDGPCPKCGAVYGWNEGFMLSAEWAVATIRELRTRAANAEKQWDDPSSLLDP